MKNHENKNEKENVAIDETLENAEEIAEEPVAEDASEIQIDFDELSFEEAVEMLKEVFAANKQTLSERDALKKDIEKEKEQSVKFKDNWYRTAAEFENYKKRNEFTRRNAYDDGVKDAVNSLLNIGDSIDRALAVELDEKTKEGVMLIKRQFGESLSALKVEVIDPIGQAFDPEHAEAIATVPTDKDEEDNVVKQVYKKGYSLNGKIMRYAQVVVAKKQ